MKVRISSGIGCLTLGFLLGGLSSLEAAKDTPVYKDLVVPVLESKCVSCHGDDKQKGKLRMDSYDALLKGGSEGKALVPGNLKDSLMMFRIGLPLDDDEHMPPEDKEQLTPEEVQLLTKWVEKGGSQTVTAAALGLDEGTVKKLLAGVKSSAAEKKAAPVATVDKAVRDKVMKEVNATGASLMQVAQDTPQLRFSALNVVDQFGDNELKKLAPVAADVIWMDLARTKVTDGGLAPLAQMKNLTKLHLENTGVGDAGLAHLKGLAQLEYLNLYKTGVTDAGLNHLQSLKNLKKLYLWQSKATPAGADRLRKAIPGLVVNLGWEYEAKPKVVAAAAPAKPAAKPAATPAPKKTEPAKPAPAKPAAKPAAPAASDELAGVRTRLQEAHAEANRLLTDAKTKASAATARKMEADGKLQKSKAQVASNQKAAGEAKQSSADLDAASKSLTAALNQVKGKKGLENVAKSLTADLAEVKKLSEQAKQKLLTAEQGLKAATASVAQAQKEVDAAAKAAADTGARVPDLQAVANAVKQALDLVNK